MRKPLHRMSQSVASKCWQQVAPISKSQISSRQSRKSSSPLYNIGLEVSSTCCETTIRRIGLCSRPSCCQSPKFFSLQPYQRRFSCCACPPQRGIKTDLDGHRVAEVVQRHEGPSPKSLDLDENLKPYAMCYFDATLRFAVIYALLEILEQKFLFFF